MLQIQHQLDFFDFVGWGGIKFGPVTSFSNGRRRMLFAKFLHCQDSSVLLLHCVCATCRRGFQGWRQPKQGFMLLPLWQQHITCAPTLVNSSDTKFQRAPDHASNWGPARDRKGTSKNLCGRDFAELSGGLPGAIYLKTLVLLGSALKLFRQSLGAVRAIFWGFGCSLLALEPSQF